MITCSEIDEDEGLRIDAVRSTCIACTTESDRTYNLCDVTAGTNCCPWIMPLHFEYGRQQIRKATTISRPHLENERGRYPLVFDNRERRTSAWWEVRTPACLNFISPSLLHIPVGSDPHPLMRDQHYGASSWKETESKSNGFEWSLSGPWVYLVSWLLHSSLLVPFLFSLADSSVPLVSFGILWPAPCNGVPALMQYGSRLKAAYVGFIFPFTANDRDWSHS